MSFKGVFKKAASLCWDNVRGGRLTLLDAIEKMDVGKAGRILQQNAEAADWDLQGASPVTCKPLHAAAASGEFNIFAILLRPEFFKGDIDVRDSQGATPLILAAREGHHVIVQALIAKGADVNAVDHLGRSALGCAAQNNRTVAMSLLIDKGAKANGPDGSRVPLGEAARREMCLPALKLLLSRGADPNHIGQLKESALESAAHEHNLAAINALITAGAEPNTPSPENGARLLNMAINSNSPELVKKMLDKGADPTLAGNRQGQNALQAAAMIEEIHPSIYFMLSERVKVLEKQRNVDGVQKEMAAGTSAAISVKPIKLRIS